MRDPVAFQIYSRTKSNYYYYLHLSYGRRNVDSRREYHSHDCVQYQHIDACNLYANNQHCKCCEGWERSSKFTSELIPENGPFLFNERVQNPKSFHIVGGTRTEIFYNLFLAAALFDISFFELICPDY